MNKEKKIIKNAFFNVTRNICTVLFPLITIPYITRILSVEKYGTITFSNTYVNYFVLLAGLGISNYAIREGSKIKTNEAELKKFVNEIFSISFVASLISYCILIGTLFLKNLAKYRLTICILSFLVPCMTIGVEWIYSIFEDYVFMSVRTILVQAISIVLMFTLVKNPCDYYKYVFLLLFSNGVPNIINFLYVHRYVKIRFTFRMNLIKHLLPIMILFSNTIMISIYVSIDTTLLGIFCDDKSVGIYSIAVKIYTVFKHILSAAIVVAIPHVTKLYSINNTDEYKKIIYNLMKILMTIMIPVCIGIIFNSNFLMWILGGKESVVGQMALRILSLSLIFSTIGSLFSSLVLLPAQKENDILRASVTGALVNSVLNLFCIQLWNYGGAAFTTLISEIIVAFFMYRKSLGIESFSIKKFVSWEVVYISCIVLIICIICSITIKNEFIRLFVEVIISAICWIYICVFRKNSNLQINKFK